VKTAVSEQWIVLQLFMQASTIIVVSGTSIALENGLKEYVLTKAKMSKRRLGSDPTQDPIFKLQFLAAMAVQYEIAIYCSVVMVPIIVTVFVWRDGVFTLEGLEEIVIVTRCDLDQMWLRYGILTAFQFGSLTLARTLLTRQMRRALLGLETFHGTSVLASEIHAARNVKKGMDAQMIINERLERSPLWRKALGTSSSAIDREDIRKELALSNLHHPTLYFRKLKRNWVFFICCLSFQLYACFAVRYNAPITFTNQPTADYPVETFTDPDLDGVPIYMHWVYIAPDQRETLANCTNLGWASP